MLNNQRIIWSDNGTLKDLSKELNDFRANTKVIPIVAAEDDIFIGSDLPFTTRYIDVSVANTAASLVSVEIWFGRQWVPAVDVIDYTLEAAGTKTLSQSGYLQWSTDRLKGWDREQDSADVTGLAGTSIYNFYWVKLSFSGNLLAGTALNYIGHRFSTDSTLYDIYPDLNNTSILTAFEAGKTTWKEQHFVAGEYIIRDLKNRQVILSDAQLLVPEAFQDASCHRVAEIIYTAMGKGYSEAATKAHNAYLEAMSQRFPLIDRAGDGHNLDDDRFLGIGFMRR